MLVLILGKHELSRNENSKFAPIISIWILLTVELFRQDKVALRTRNLSSHTSTALIF